MILNQDNEYTALLDACVLVPMCLCDTLLRFAKDPAMYRPLWSSGILQEVGDALENKLNIAKEKRERRIAHMTTAFPEAMVEAPQCVTESLTGIPDPNDRHVLAAAICGHAHAIVTNNLKDFPKDYLAQFDILCQSADDFLIHQFHLNPFIALEKLDGQAVNIQQKLTDVLNTLQQVAPNFAATVEKML
jgi:predicted nucleic acid-binding protein